MKSKFLGGKNQSLAFIGVSGSGKTTLSRLFPENEWFHYSVDYRIWTHYLSTELNDYLKSMAMEHPVLSELLHKDAITVEHRVEFKNLLATSSYMGMLGNPKLGGSDEQSFRSRMKHYKTQERSAMLDIGYFMARARKLYGYQHFITDASGSVCEVIDIDNPNDEVLKVLTSNSLIVYIEASEKHIVELINRYKSDPKPIYYRDEFLQEQIPEFLRQMKGQKIEDFNPADVGSYMYEKVLRARLPRYKKLAKHGVTVTMDELKNVNNYEDLLELIDQKLSK